MTHDTKKAYDIAKERYAALGVDTEKALETLASVSLSIHCWQGDDVGGFETPDAALDGGGIAVTGNFPGRARTLDELRADVERAMSCIPGRHRLNLHAIYGDFGGKKVDRDAIGPEHFASWIDWAKSRGVGLDFNATLFSHPKAAEGYTLSHRDKTVRDFWSEHVRRCREIGAHMGRELGTPCVHNLWIPDGSKDLTPSRHVHRQWLKESLDSIYETSFSSDQLKDAVESKLFGIGSESYVVGSHEFYYGWAMKNGVMVCLDLGHFHPTESVADKLSAMLPFFDELLLHVSRPVRWDSDHVVIFSDDLQAVMEETVRADALGRVRMALDFFDAELNRVGAWSIGSRATLQALLKALLEPTETLRQYEAENNKFGRLALLETLKTMPFGAVWDHYCERCGVPVGAELIDSVMDYERSVLVKREG